MLRLRVRQDRVHPAVERRVRPLVVAALLALVIAFTPAVPEGRLTAQADSGPWWELGIGAGWVNFTCDVCADERDAGPVGRIAFGGVASPQTRIAIEGTGWTHMDDEDDVRQNLFSVLGLAVVRPRDGPVSFTGGAGWVGWRAEDFSYNALGIKVGLAYAMDLGGDMRLQNSLALTASSFGSLQNDGEVAEEDVSLSFLTFTISVSAR